MKLKYDDLLFEIDALFPKTIKLITRLSQDEFRDLINILDENQSTFNYTFKVKTSDNLIQSIMVKKDP
ncbi:hypothetical protein I2F27_06365 [Acinetobacter sp. B5B]|uniref:hypothetical protein n=1 Tax=Acinetobacter TaxID=469 RepID=UPI0018A317A3|nr:MULTISPECIES: hypothetical protein [Acinetobacter]MBF7682950.1 hypothetical protein [Acinetobacter baretiae]MBF7696227.1 hypothetical protein [Acinetobacter rathckeae]